MLKIRIFTAELPWLNIFEIYTTPKTRSRDRRRNPPFLPHQSGNRAPPRLIHRHSPVNAPKRQRRKREEKSHPHRYSTVILTKRKRRKREEKKEHQHAPPYLPSWQIACSSYLPSPSIRPFHSPWESSRRPPPYLPSWQIACSSYLLIPNIRLFHSP